MNTSELEGAKGAMFSISCYHKNSCSNYGNCSHCENNCDRKDDKGKTEVYYVSWYENCSPEDRECGRYEENDKSYEDYFEALAVYEKKKESGRYNVQLSKEIHEILETHIVEYKCEHDFDMRYQIDCDKDEEGEYLIYTSRCRKCYMTKASEKVYIYHKTTV